MAKRTGAAPPPQDRRGTPVVGRIATMLVGQGYGFIRLSDAREIYFHRGDLQEGTSFNELHVGDAVDFELLEDSVSGARALRVARRKRTR
jgi:cold shock CspA family protein